MAQGPGPDFIGAGFSRCGTTSLYAYLRCHPDMWMPPLKEITYWDLERVDGRHASKRRGRMRFAAAHTVHNPLGWSHRIDDARFLARYAILHPSDQWYAELFAPARGRITGDLSPSYMRLSEQGVRDLDAQHPDVKVFFMLRDPFDRAWSNGRKALARARNRTMAEVDDDEIATYLTTPKFLMNCDYVTPLRRWRSIIGPERIFIGFTDDLDHRPDEFLDRLSAFIGVDPAPLLAAQREIAREFTTGSLGGAIPPRWEQLLARHLEPMTGQLADDVGGQAIDWHDRAMRALKVAADER